MTETELTSSPHPLQTLDPSDKLTTEWIKISLEPILTLSQLNDLKAQLLPLLGRRVQLSGARVERIDTASLQLLLTFINSPEVTAGWVEPSPELCIATRLLGLSSHLSLPMTEVTKPF